MSLQPRPRSPWSKLALPVIPAFVLVLAAGVAIACGEDGETSTPTSTDQSTADPTPTSTATPDQDVDAEFDITDRDMAAARLSYLYEILADGNPVSDPIGWAKAGAAASRVDEICNNFEISEDLDPACDQMLLVLETPFNQLGPILAAASSELRRILPRRKLAEYQDVVRVWDGDIGEWEFSREELDLLSDVRDETKKCADAETLCTDNRAAHLLGGMLSIAALHQDSETVASQISVLALSDLFDYVGEFAAEDSSYGRQLDAERILDELDDLGIY